MVCLLGITGSISKYLEGTQGPLHRKTRTSPCSHESCGEGTAATGHKLRRSVGVGCSAKVSVSLSAPRRWTGVCLSAPGPTPCVPRYLTWFLARGVASRAKKSHSCLVYLKVIERCPYSHTFWELSMPLPLVLPTGGSFRVRSMSVRLQVSYGFAYLHVYVGAGHDMVAC